MPFEKSASLVRDENGLKELECEHFDLAAWSVRATIQRTRDDLAATFTCPFDIAVADMGEAQRHAEPFVAEQARDDGQRNAPQNGLNVMLITGE